MDVDHIAQPVVLLTKAGGAACFQTPFLAAGQSHFSEIELSQLRCQLLLQFAKLSAARHKDS